ncbi:MAG TPA: hypothetical protein VFI27_04435 [candidate division Zixibacteria bacterium]|nr:hypothetical protein [candidate division Zixibacteria bacterium]
MTISGWLKQRDWRWLGINYALPFLFYLILTLVITWPVVRDFATLTAGDNDDVRHYMWFLWHIKEWFLGHQSLYTAPQLYYPAGISTFAQSTGPLNGILALPFWPWGPAAAFNGLMLMGQALTGYMMYLLSREMGARITSALFAGLLFLVFPIHLATVFGRLDLAFLGLLPLIVWALHRAMTPTRSRWWSVVVAIILLLTLLHHGLVFIFALMLVAFFGIVFFFQANRHEWGLLGRRLALLGISSLILAGPLLFAMASISRDPAYFVDMNQATINYQPDFIELLIPAPNSRLLGEAALQVIWKFNLVTNSVETWIYVTGTGLFLALVALFSRQKRALPWLLFFLIMALLALGPSLQLFGRRQFTEYGLEIILPYALLTALPGLEFLRTPGRFMMVGSIGLAMGAAFGLDWLGHRFPKAEWPLTALFMVVLLLEVWPQSWPQGQMLEISPFYEQIAGDDEMYGIFDLPLKDHPQQSVLDYSARYQMFQMTHGKGIANGYISRPYKDHPIFPCLIPEIAPANEVTITGVPVSCADNTLYDLASNDFRYVVWHKAQDGGQGFEPGSWGEEQAKAFIARYFEGQDPVYEDDLLVVYAVPPVEQLESQPLVVALADNWYGREESWRWAGSPATLRLTVDQPINAYFTLVPAIFYQPDGGPGGRLTVALDDGWSTTITIYPDELVSIPIALPAGTHDLSLELEAGNFRPADHGGTDPRELSFAIRSIDFMVGGE